MFSGNVRLTTISDRTMICNEDWVGLGLTPNGEVETTQGRDGWSFIFVNPCFSWAKGWLHVGFACKIRRNIRMFNRKEFGLLWRNP